ncbi:MAG: DUF29 domain-containing protein [Gloeomargarita sp. SKYG116]|nr:DUF29 domain-containing protein [Gloeomargarita sp. SKYG116]MDW8401982.1 DUF29 domain-containing protein [Gloeomargarita sp. SKYGB_i_bin116]
MAPVGEQPHSLYEQDYQGWIGKTVQLLRTRDFDQIDLENLIEEIESLGRSEKRAVLSYLIRLCEHLLKLKYWESEWENCSRQWQQEIANFRLEIELILEDSPSLKNYLQEQFIGAYQKARRRFLATSGLPEQAVPKAPNFTLEQALDEWWL